MAMMSSVPLQKTRVVVVTWSRVRAMVFIVVKDTKCSSHLRDTRE
jgi:hypothetical protein